ncbi:MAG: hypothetical protein LBE13_04985 [Bacteroidales bacterium]|nr:hypothetical protein [Bacteroidales bacterium]
MKKILFYTLVIAMFSITACSKNDDEENVFIEIPDEGFRSFAIKNYDTNKDGKISVAEAKRVNRINCFTKINNVRSLEEIEYFTNLRVLWCSGGIEDNDREGELTTVDLSKNTKLTDLDCSQNKITTLDLSNNNKLKYFKCYNNKISSLNLSNNTELTKLDCNNNKILSFDLSKNVNEISLNCDFNSISTFDISKRLLLEDLSLFLCEIQTLDLSKHTKLRSVGCFMDTLVTLISNKRPLL